MRTTNKFLFRKTGKDPKEMVRACIEEMLGSVPDNEGFTLSGTLRVSTCTPEEDEGGDDCFIIESVHTSLNSISYQTVFTPSEAGRL